MSDTVAMRRLVQPMGPWDAISAAPSRAGPRERVSDDELKLYIVEMAAAGIQLYTPQLHHLRRTGVACEQSRLRRLYDQVNAERPSQELEE